MPRRTKNAERVRRWRERKKLFENQKAPISLNVPFPVIQPVEEQEEIRLNVFPNGPYESQRRFLELLETKRFVLLRAGRQLGKSTVGMAAMVRQIYEKPTPMGTGWIVSPTYPMAEQLRWKIEDSLGQLIVDKREGNTPVYYFEPPPGRKGLYRVEVKTAEKPDRLRGATLDWVWLDEARNMDGSVWPILLPTVAVSRGPIFVTTTPSGKDWVWEKISQPAERGSKDFGLVVAKSAEAKHFTNDDIYLMRSQMSEEMARQELDAEIIAFDGMVYGHFSTDIHVVDPLEETPKDAAFVGGIDWGWKDPFVHLTILKTQDKYYIVDEYYKSGQFLDEHSKAIKGRPFYAAVQRRWADPSRPEFISELLSKGISSFPAKNDIKLGIDCIKKLLEQRRLFVCRNCVETIREFSRYHYPARTDRNTKDIPVDAWNHTMDAVRYTVFNEESFSPQNPFSVMEESGEIKTYTEDADFIGISETFEENQGVEGFW